MEELKLECLVEGYEGTYFEVGQVWETRGGSKLKVKDFDFGEDTYKVTLVELGEDGDTTELYYTKKGEYWVGEKDENDLVKLIINKNESEGTTEPTPTKQSQPKTFSEYLKENNAYESFVENCVKYFLGNINDFYAYKEDKILLCINNTFLWQDTREGQDYWSNLDYYIPHNIVNDMNEIIFKEVDKRIAEQKASTKYMVFVEGKNTPRYIHDSYDSAEKEAKRLSAKEIGCNVFVVEIVKTFKSKVIVEEI